MMLMNCPKCERHPLTETRVKGREIRIDYCDKCKGVWFDGGELEAVLGVAAKELSVPSSAKKRGRTCPSDGEMLYAFKYPQTLVVIDMCKKCGGLWLDHSEMKEIRAVRSDLKRRGKLETHAPVTGVRGGLLGFIDAALSKLGEV